MEIGWDGAMRTPHAAGEELIWYNLFAETLGNIHQRGKWAPVSSPTLIFGLQRTSEPVPQEARGRMAMATWSYQNSPTVTFLEKSQKHCFQRKEVVKGPLHYEITYMFIAETCTQLYMCSILPHSISVRMASLYPFDR